MRFEDTIGGRIPSVACDKKKEELRKLCRETAALKRQIEELLFAASYRCECNRMSSIPQGAFTALQVRKNFERTYTSKYQREEQEEEPRDNKNCGFNAKVLQEGRELTPLKYNSKLMNSIWGLYNRYSVHNFKKIDANEARFLAETWGATFAPVGAADAVVARDSPAARIIGANGAGH